MCRLTNEIAKLGEADKARRSRGVCGTEWDDVMGKDGDPVARGNHLKTCYLTERDIQQKRRRHMLLQGGGTEEREERGQMGRERKWWEVKRQREEKKKKR